MPDDKGLFMPQHFPKFSSEFLKAAPNLSFAEIADETAKTLLNGAIDEAELSRIVREAVNFDAPLVKISERIYALELFHGPTLAFKDFGARFMAGLMSYFVKDENTKLTILVATSGDTGGAVANGFLGKEGIDVIILYPESKVSYLQELQLTTLGQNITAIKVKGTFDDCQRLVKTAFVDEQLRNKFQLSSANSINIARLIPQGFYYVYAWSRMIQHKLPVVFCVPSGNFGNISAGLFVWKMGLPVHHFIAATNLNDAVPRYLASGKYDPVAAVQTISNAMDVGDPSNFYRMLDLFDGDWSAFKAVISGCSISDEATKNIIASVYKNEHYLLDPHGAVAYLALSSYLEKNADVNGIFLETAHPGKFLEVVEEIIDEKIKLPEVLEALKGTEGSAISLSDSFEDFKSYLLSR